MQYFQASDDKRADIVQVIGNLLGLTQQEIQQVWKPSSDLTCHIEKSSLQLSLISKNNPKLNFFYW